MEEWVVTKMSKKKYFKSVPKNCKVHKGDHCTCMIAGHRYWMSKKYYGGSVNARYVFEDRISQ